MHKEIHTHTHTRESFDVRAGGWRRTSKAGVERWRIREATTVDAGCMLAAANHKKQCNVSGSSIGVVILVINAIIIIFIIIIIITYSTIRINLSILGNINRIKYWCARIRRQMRCTHASMQAHARTNTQTDKRGKHKRKHTTAHQSQGFGD